MIEAEQALITICVMVACLVCFTRFYLRVIIQRRIELLEFALICALVMEIALAAEQLRIFELLPTMQNPSHFIEVQKLFFSGTFFYLASLWSVKISINLLHIRLTKKIPRIQFLAVYNLYFLFGTWPLLYVILFAACLPLERNWALPSGRQCTPMIHAWDFWVHFAIHLGTDIILCILPFPALLKVTESRLRLAICGVYSLAIVAIIVSVVRIVLLVTDVQNSIKRIMVLTTFELTVCIVVGVLPGISSSFTKRYAGVSEPSKFTASKGIKSGQRSRSTFVQLPGNNSSVLKVEDHTDNIELRQSGHHALVFAEEVGERNSLTGSTDKIIEPAKGVITKVTHIDVTMNSQ